MFCHAAELLKKPKELGFRTEPRRRAAQETRTGVERETTQGRPTELPTKPRRPREVRKPPWSRWTCPNMHIPAKYNYCIALHYIALHCIVLRYLAWYYIDGNALHYIALRRMVLHYLAWYWMATHCIAFSCIVLPCRVLHPFTWNASIRTLIESNYFLTSSVICREAGTLRPYSECTYVPIC